jgi:hypothetical protein
MDTKRLSLFIACVVYIEYKKPVPAQWTDNMESSDIALLAGIVRVLHQVVYWGKGERMIVVMNVYGYHKYKTQKGWSCCDAT